jgi:hypothetical protein
LLYSECVPFQGGHDIEDAVDRPIMSEREELPHALPDVAAKAHGGPDAHRIFLLECRMEQMRARVDEARAEAHRARALVAEATAREADHARRQRVLHEELAAAREEVGSLHHRLEHSEALRAGLEGRLFESTRPEDGRELVRLRGEVAAHRDLTVAAQRTAAELRTRVAELTASRETLLSRVAEWQIAARAGDTAAVDLAEFIAILSRDVLELEHRSAVAERGEAELREELLRASAQGYVSATVAVAPAAEAPPPAASASAAEEPADEQAKNDEAAAPAAGDEAAPRADALLRLGRSGDAEALEAILPSLAAPDPGVRAAAYQALGHLLEPTPSLLEPHVRAGIADADPRVRRRVVLVAAAARGLPLARLLEPLRQDSNPQVRRVVQEVLRRAPADGAGEDAAVPEQLKSGAAS